MVTIAHLVEKIVEQKPFLQEALSRGIVNNAALAEELIPQIEKELGKKVKFSAVNMAIRRLSEKLNASFIAKAKFDQRSDITVKSDLVEITLFKSEDVQRWIKEVYGIVDLKKGDFLSITLGMYEIMVVANKRHEAGILNLLPKKAVRMVIKNLSSLTISIPEEAVETVGLFYAATRALNWENINIIDIISTLTEMTFIVREKDTARAFNSLKDLISSQC